MGIVTLPLHVWDRELDSRIFLAALLASDNNLVFFGHEYNLAPLYKCIEKVFHFGAGRPIYNEPRTNQWYEPIVDKGGFNGLVFEEGLNDIDSASEAMFRGINHRSEASTSAIYSWTEREKKLLLENTPIESKNMIANKVKICGNARLELLGEIGNKYFHEATMSLNQVFGDYILISDNFGGIEMYGSKKQYDPTRDLRQRCDSDEVGNIMQGINAKIEKAKWSRIEFCKIVNQLIIDYPHIPFILRPHPVADPSFWHQNIIKRRNIHILYKDNIQPWINGSMLTIHSGCTVGIEAELSSNISIDISEIYDDQRSLGLSSKISTNKPKNYTELKSLIKEVFENANRRRKTHGEIDADLGTRSILKQNLHSLNKVAIEKLSKLGHAIPNVSSLLQVRGDAQEFFQEEDMDERKRMQILFEANQIIGNLPPLQQKSRYYTSKELDRKIKRVVKILKLETELRIIKLRRENVFGIFQEK